MAKNLQNKVQPLFFKEMTPLYPVGSLLQVSDDYTDSICFFCIPGVSCNPENFFKDKKDMEFVKVLCLKSGDVIYYLGTYKNKIKNRMCVYHRFLYENMIVYAIDDSFMNEMGVYFKVIA